MKPGNKQEAAALPGITIFPAIWWRAENAV